MTKGLSNMNLGIFGGTFNPIHMGHISASLRFYDEAGLDSMLVIPDRIPPHKEGTVASADDRLNMLHLVYDDKGITGNRNIIISDMELKREGKSYTVVTLRELQILYPGAKLFLYTGSDMFYTLESWREGAQILRMCTIYTCAREINEHEKLCEYARLYKDKYGTECIISDSDPLVASSTEIRNVISTKNDNNCFNFTNSLLIDSVKEYIIKRGLYSKTDTGETKKLIETVKKQLPVLVSEKRLSHIMSVTETARFLADFFVSIGAQANCDKVMLSALLHDITKCMDQEELCREYKIILSDDDIFSMQTVHAITGAYYAKNKYGIDDEIFNSIKRHTVGSENMSLTDKIIFVSDYCEETREHEQCKVSRNMLFEMIEKSKRISAKERLSAAMTDFDFITADILGKTVKYLRSIGKPVHSTTVRSFEYIISQYKNNGSFRLLFEKYMN